MTADATPSTARACQKAGMHAVLTKPIDSLRLARVISDLTPSTQRSVVQKPEQTNNLDTARIDSNMLQSLQEMIGSDKVDELIELFHETCTETIKEIVQAASASDRDLVASLAHHLKGGALNMGLGAVSDSAIALEQVVKSGGEIADLEESINDLSNA